MLPSLTAHELAARYRSGAATPDAGHHRVSGADRGASTAGARLPHRDPGGRARARPPRRTPASRRARRGGRWTACRSRSRISSARAASAPRAARGSSSASCRPTTPRWSRGSTRRGAVLLGKLNMDEFAMGSSTEHSGFCTTRNPWDLARVPGGSSGGASAAVAADLAAAQPRHRHRRVDPPARRLLRRASASSPPTAASRATASSPSRPRSTRSGRSRSTWRTRRCCCGSSRAPIRWTRPRWTRRSPTTGPRSGRESRACSIGIPAEYFIDGMDPEVEAAVRAAIAALEKLGARTEPVSLPHTEYGLAAYYVIAPAEASSNLARYDGVKYGLRAPGGARPDRHVQQDPRGRLRQRGQAPHHAGHVRRSPPATTTPTTVRPRRSARWCGATSSRPSRAWT